MSPRQIAALICKTFGLYLFIVALSSLPGTLLFVFALRTRPDLGGAAGSLALLTSTLNIIPPLIQFFAGLILWLIADNLAVLMCPEGNEESNHQLKPEQGQALLFSGLGVWTLLQTLPRFGQILIRLFLFTHQDPMMRNDYSGMTGPEIIGLLIQFGLGCWLLFGTQSLVRLLGSFGKVESGDSVE